MLSLYFRIQHVCKCLQRIAGQKKNNQKLNRKCRKRVSENSYAEKQAYSMVAMKRATNVVKQKPSENFLWVKVDVVKTKSSDFFFLLVLLHFIGNNKSAITEVNRSFASNYLDIIRLRKIHSKYLISHDKIIYN